MRIFTEKQRFNQWFMHLVIWGTMAILVFAIYKINYSATDEIGSSGRLIFNLVMAVSAVILLLVYATSLRTRIDEKGVYYQMFPFHFKMKLIPWSDLEICETRTYSPIGEYGGWGYRISFSRSGKALNTSGNKGIQLQFKNGKKLLIGTQIPEEAQRTINYYFKKTAS